MVSAVIMIVSSVIVMIMGTRIYWYLKKRNNEIRKKEVDEIVDRWTKKWNEEINNERPASEITFKDIISQLYIKLSASQEDLGHEFKNVYFKNAWNLYES